MQVDEMGGEHKNQPPMRLEERIRSKLATRDILLMTHIVVGYPSLRASLELVDAMVEAGVDLMELQIPFSEPIADGPVILHASQVALRNGVTVNQCLDFAANVTSRHAIPFLFMSYYNILFKRGLSRFADQSHRAGIQGTIVPDCPPEEGQEYIACMKERGLSPIFLFSPRTPDERLNLLGKVGSGFVYVVARRGVTGTETEFSDELAQYLAKCRAATPLPLAVGFGISTKKDVTFLKGKADIAIVGTQTIRVLQTEGVSAVGRFLKDLRG